MIKESVGRNDWVVVGGYYLAQGFASAKQSCLD